MTGPLARLSRWRMLAAEGAMAAVFLGACAAMVARSIPSAPPPPSPHSAALPAGGLSHATLRVVTGTPVLRIGVANLGASRTLLRVSTPAGSPAPRLRTARPDGTARTGGSALIYLSAKEASAVTVTLSAAVIWRLDLASGTGRTVADLRGGQVAGITVTKGSNVIDLTLPRPRGSVPVRLTAGTHHVLLSLPDGVPVRVTAAAGAGEISLEGQRHAAVPSGSAFTTPGWAPAVPGIDIDAVKCAARLDVTTQAG